MVRRQVHQDIERAKAAAREALVSYLASLDHTSAHTGKIGPQPIWHQPRPDEWTIGLVGSAQQTINVELSLGEYTLQMASFFMRGPDENHAEVYRRLLRRNLENVLVKFAADEFGDLYLRADLPLSGVTETDLDRAIGIFYACADSNYLPIMRLGFGSSMPGSMTRQTPP